MLHPKISRPDFRIRPFVSRESTTRCPAASSVLRSKLTPLLHEDGIAKLKAAYLKDGRAPSNTAYSFVARRT